MNSNVDDSLFNSNSYAYIILCEKIRYSISVVYPVCSIDIGLGNKCKAFQDSVELQRTQARGKYE